MVRSNRRTGGVSDSWSTSFLNLGPDAHSITAQVLCAKGLKATEGKGEASLPPGSTTGMGANTPTATASAPCPKGKALLGGGWDLPFNVSGPQLVIDSTPVGGRWQTRAVSLDAAVAHQMYSWSYCG